MSVHEHVRRDRWADDDLLEREIEKVFSVSWQFLAHETEIPESGDYVLRRMGRDNVIVVRDEDGRIRVHLNTCRHRGVPL